MTSLFSPTSLFDVGDCRLRRSGRRQDRRNIAKKKPKLERNRLSTNFENVVIPLKTRGFIRKIKNGE